MRRFATVVTLSVALAAGLATTGSPAAASSKPTDIGVADAILRHGTISGTDLLARAQREGIRYTGTEAAAIMKASCRWIERTQGRRTSRHGRWLIWVKVRLNWCYNGNEVVSAKARYRSYTSNRSVWRWRGWAKKRLTHTNSWSSAQTQGQGRFYYTGNRYTYKPYITVRGDFDGGYRWWAGG